MMEENLKTEDWPKFSGCIFDYARFRMTLNSFPPLKNQRVKGSRARLIAKFCLPWDREDLLGWEGDEDAFWAEVKKTCLEEVNVLTALRKRIQESVPDWVEDPSGNQVKFWLSLRELECASVSVGIVDKLRHSEILAEIIQKMGASYLPWEIGRAHV